MRHEPKIYIGILFKRSYSDHNYEIECELNSSKSNYSDRFKVEVPLRSIAFDQNKAVTLHSYLHNYDLDQSILLSEFDLNGKKTDIAFD